MKRLLGLTSLVIIALAGCIPLPASNSDVARQGRQVEEKDLLFLNPGQTQRAEVVDRLGSPDVVWETERIHVYRSDRVTGRVLWAVPVGPYAASFGLTDVSEQHVLLIEFDDMDKVKRFELVERRAFETLGELLRRWHAAPKKVAP